MGGLFLTYLIVLQKYLVFEDIVILYFLPLLLMFVPIVLVFFIIKVFKKIRYNSFLIIIFIGGLIFQTILLIFITNVSKIENYSRDDIVSSIDNSVKMMELAHPNFYSEINKNIFLQKVDSIKSTILENNTETEVYVYLSKVFSLIKDGHTGTSLDFLFNSGKFLFRNTLPYKLKVDDNKLYVIGNYFYRNKIPIGSEIIQINGKSTQKWFNEIAKIANYENEQFLKANIQWPFFWGFLNNFENYEIKYITPKEKTKTIRTSGGLLSKLLFLFDIKLIGNDYSFSILDNDIGYIQFNSFNNEDKFATFLGKSFAEMKNKNIDNLIIDIRQNLGGNSILGDSLLQYLCNSDFKVYDSCFVKLSKTIVERGWEEIDTITQKIGDLKVYNKSEDLTVKKRESSLDFKGKVILLQSKNTFSSASDFAASFKCYNIGKIIGEETGGLTVSYGNNFSFQASEQVPISLVVSTTKYYVACGVEDRKGVEPDYYVVNSIKDYILGEDRVLNFAIELIKHKDK